MLWETTIPPIIFGVKHENNNKNDKLNINPLNSPNKVKLDSTSSSCEQVDVFSDKQKLIKIQVEKSTP